MWQYRHHKIFGDFKLVNILIDPGNSLCNHFWGGPKKNLNLSCTAAPPSHLGSFPVPIVLAAEQKYYVGSLVHSLFLGITLWVAFKIPSHSGS
jgi:hypothetical protein